MVPAANAVSLWSQELPRHHWGLARGLSEEVQPDTIFFQLETVLRQVFMVTTN